MKVLFIITRSNNPGGANVHVKDMAKFLKEKNHQVLVLVGGDGEFLKDLEELDINYKQIANLVNAINPIKDSLALLDIYKKIKKFRPDIISTHTSKAGWIGRIASKLTGTPVVYTPHCFSFLFDESGIKTFLYKWFEKLAVPFTDKLIMVSQFEYNETLRLKITNEERLIVIQNGMPSIGDKLLANPQKSPPKLVMVARFEDQKDHFTLIEAIKSLTDLNWDLDLIGDGKNQQEIKRLAKEYEIIDRVSFIGEVRDVKNYLAESQIFLLITKWESFPRSILEAMRAGLPVIASDVGGINEMVGDANGALVPKGDIKTLSSELRELISKPEKRLQKGEKSRQLYLDNFTFDKMYIKTLDIYREVLNRKLI